MKKVRTAFKFVRVWSVESFEFWYLCALWASSTEPAEVTDLLKLKKKTFAASEELKKLRRLSLC